MGAVGSSEQGMVDAWLPSQACAWYSSQIILMCELVFCYAAGVYFPLQAFSVQRHAAAIKNVCDCHGSLLPAQMRCKIMQERTWILMGNVLDDREDKKTSKTNTVTVLENEISVIFCL